MYLKNKNLDNELIKNCTFLQGFILKLKTDLAIKFFCLQLMVIPKHQNLDKKHEESILCTVIGMHDQKLQS